jgi:hypothetical protein
MIKNNNGKIIATCPPTTVVDPTMATFITDAIILTPTSPSTMLSPPSFFDLPFPPANNDDSNNSQSLLISHNHHIA